MRWVRAALLTAATAIPLTGCGTVRNLASGDPDNFGGVQRDLQFASDATSHGGLMAEQGSSAGDSAANSPGKAFLALAMLGVWGADLTLSAVGDTATLPLAMYLRHKHEDATVGDAGAAP